MRIALLVLLVAVAAPPAAAQQAATGGEGGAQAAAPQQPDGLVSAAKEAKKKRRNPSAKVLTNADVKNSKGRLIILAEPDAAAVPAGEGANPLSPLEKQDLERRQRLEHEEKVSAAREKVIALERELESIEYRYYEENDPDRRDKLIRRQFQETRTALETARAHLRSIDPQP